MLTILRGSPSRVRRYGCKPAQVRRANGGNDDLRTLTVLRVPVKPAKAAALAAAAAEVAAVEPPEVEMRTASAPAAEAVSPPLDDAALRKRMLALFDICEATGVGAADAVFFLDAALGDVTEAIDAARDEEAAREEAAGAAEREALKACEAAARAEAITRALAPKKARPPRASRGGALDAAAAAGAAASLAIARGDIAPPAAANALAGDDGVVAATPTGDEEPEGRESAFFFDKVAFEENPFV